MDYKQLSENDNEYFELFQSSRWEHMCSYGPYHFFSAPRETVPIYTDKDNYLSKYESSKHGYKKAAIMSLTMIIVITLIKFLLGSKVERIIIINIVNFLVDFSVIGLLGVIIIG